MIKITILLTCHNRKKETKACIDSLYDSEYKIFYVVTDDGSTDGTGEMLNTLKKNYCIETVLGDGNLYWCGGMFRAIAYVQGLKRKTDYYVIVNDDVVFEHDALKCAIKRSREMQDAVIVGVTCDKKGALTYGGVRYKGRGIKYDTIGINDDTVCDTFNCNFVLLPQKVFDEAGNFDSFYQHAMADFDYGLKISRSGNKIYTTDRYIGICERNSRKGTWLDPALSRKERCRIKESPKGLPYKEWHHYLKKNFGGMLALWHTFTPYIKILLGK